MDDEAFVDELATRLAGLPTVEAVALGGSRAQGTHRPDSDWDLAIYYRGDFDPNELRALGYPGEVSQLGGEGSVFGGGAWLRVDGRAVDVLFRDLADIEAELAAAEAGRVRIEALSFHLAGVPSYLVIAELALCRVLRGELPRPAFPAALRRSASAAWWGRARLHLDYARNAHASAGRAAQCLAMLTVAASQTSHAVLAARGEWITNEKTLLDRAGLRGIDWIVTSVSPDADGLRAACDAIDALCSDAVLAASRS
ncbi:nucleotidyltransferase domain-containing protein [Lysinimonas soli]|uniref:Nucleotidyltransferase domain-containing protein n=1 Tax=Lysinimonas soli TaxID=1074233 RepID=A0ABW0NSI1_9MICO